MKTNKLIVGLGLALSLGILYTGCKKAKDSIEEKAATDTDTSTAKENSTSENASMEVFKSINEVANADAKLKSGFCYSVTTDTTVGAGAPWPKTVTIDFTGCTGKSGKLIAVFSGSWNSNNSMVTLYGENLVINNEPVGFANVGSVSNAWAKRMFSTVSYVECNWTDVTIGTGNFSCTRQITQTAGASTNTASDDVYEITGYASGRTSAGKSYTADISSPLIMAGTCKYISQGVMTITNNGGGARTFDFGDGTCDNKAKVTISGVSFDITM